MAMIAIADGKPTNKVAVHWACKLANRKARQYAFLDLGATSGAAPEEDEPDLDDTGEMTRKYSCALTDAPGRQPRKCSSSIS
jgi:hypothetical protein